MVDSVFVYGTLKRGQLREKHWPHPPLSVRPAFVLARLFDLGPYPAIVAGNMPVGGQLWRFPEQLVPETLDVLDVIEGFVPGRGNNLYERIMLNVHLTPLCQDPAPILAYAYQMESHKLPPTAKEIFPIDQIAFASWPVDDLPPNLTSILPDPYPDDVVD